ncbi:P-loop containing nucleoside triphosphate hydrolase protein [Mycena crocata]|nr:P-loop containing nucleoside triphosphate hydrolase protein [Mycena crocata]
MSTDTLVANDRDAWTIALVGAPGVGKTRFISRDLESSAIKQEFSRQIFVDGQKTIITLVDVYQSQHGTHDEDAAGAVLRDADAFILMYSTTSPYSLQDVVAYTCTVRRAKATYAHDPVLLLVANQSDRPAQDQEVSSLEGSALAKELNCGYAEVSAKTGYGVQGVAEALVRILRAEKEQRTRKQGRMKSVWGFLTRR